MTAAHLLISLCSPCDASNSVVVICFSVISLNFFSVNHGETVRKALGFTLCEHGGRHLQSTAPRSRQGLTCKHAAIAASISALGKRLPDSHWLQVDLQTPRVSAATYIFSPDCCRNRFRLDAKIAQRQSRWRVLDFVFRAGMAESGIRTEKVARTPTRVSTETLACPYRNTKLKPRQWARLRSGRLGIKNCQFSVETILRVNALNCQISSWFWAFFLV